MEHIAIDLGGSKSHVHVRNADGTVVDDRAWETAKLGSYLKGRTSGRVVLETCSEAFAVADAAQAAGHEVRVVPATLARALGVGARGVKTDRRDAAALSEASCRMDLGSVHVPSVQSRERKALCTMREALVSARTQLINSVRGWMRTQLIAVRTGTPMTFPKRVRRALEDRPQGLAAYVERQLVVIETLTTQIVAANAELKKMADADPTCKRLRSVPGVGPLTAVRFTATIDCVARFRSAHAVESYLGLTPGENSSSLRVRRTSITKAGSARARWTLLQAAWCAIRTRPSDPMVRWALQIAERRGRNVGVVALARKMAGILFAIWRDGTTYDPKRNAPTPDEPLGGLQPPNPL